MLGIEHQIIYCGVTKCPHNEKGELLDGKTKKVVQTDYTCTKEYIHLNSKGKCKEAA